MCSRVQPQSSAFDSATATTSTPVQKSLGIRQEKDLKRDDSGIFSSSPSPLTTPSPRGTVFPLPTVSSQLQTTAPNDVDGAMATSSSSNDATPPPADARGVSATATDMLELGDGQPVASGGWQQVREDSCMHARGVLALRIAVHGRASLWMCVGTLGGYSTCYV